jgi:hypothetical protein
MNRASLTTALAASLIVAACSTAPPKRPLAAGYYIFDARGIGVTRRIIIVPGERRVSYDVSELNPRCAYD